MHTSNNVRLIVAGVQIAASFGNTQSNLARAEQLVSPAAAAGAQLVLLPELMPSGYTLCRDLWQYAEPAGGMTEAWLRRVASGLSIWLGTSYLQAEGNDFYNTFALAGPDGAIAGRVRKQFPAFSEPFFFRGAAGSHCINTPIGRIGVGICNDNHMSVLPQILADAGADILLMPHAWPLACTPDGKGISQADVDRQRELALGLAPLYARLLGIPTIMVNHCGPCTPVVPPGLIIKLLPSADHYRFPGLSTIADAGGQVVARAGGEDGFVIGEVALDSARKCRQPVPNYGGMIYPGAAGRYLIRVDETLGKVSYRCNKERKQQVARIIRAAGDASVNQ